MRKIDGFSSQLIDNNSGDSVMREFLQSGIEFKWPPHLGECSGNHCDLSLNNRGIPLKWKKKISDKKASIDIYEALPDFNFGKAFVVKTIRDPDSRSARRMTANEVENMRDLRHPHITALLGTFTYQARLNILIFPAACCDLQQFMDQMSEGTRTPDSTTSDSRHLHSLDAAPSEQSRHGGAHDDSWLVMLPIERKFEILRGYFVCLSQALRYLHEQGVRHKDIKPANILIDRSESVILTDFGISRRFPKDKSHVTNDEWNFTRKYASPEIMKDRKMPRDDASDVFSLGCVFLEMATLLLENKLDGLSEHCSTTVNESAKDEAYHRNLENVHIWIDHLRTSRGRGFRPVREHWVPDDDVVLVSREFLPTSDNHLIAALVGVRRMLDEAPHNRPASNTLWQQFEDISSKICRDCDPRSREMWQPSARQKTAAEAGLSNRRSLHTEEVELEDRDRKKAREANSTILFASNVPRQLSPLSRDLHSPMVEDRRTIVSRPDSPRSEFRIDTEEDAIQALTSAPPRLQFPDEELETAGPQDILESVSASSTATTHHRIPKSPTGGMSPTKPTRLHQLQTQHTATNTVSPSMISSSREPQHGGTNQRRSAYHETIVRIPERDMPQPETPIIVYNVSNRDVFQTNCDWLKGALKGQDILCCPLPRVRQKIDIGDKAKFTAKVDLGPLGWRNRMRRLRGKFPKLYVIH